VVDHESMPPPPAFTLAQNSSLILDGYKRATDSGSYPGESFLQLVFDVRGLLDAGGQRVVDHVVGGVQLDGGSAKVAVHLGVQFVGLLSLA